MANAMPIYRAEIYMAEDDLLLLIKTADALDEIGAIELANIVRQCTQQFTRIPHEKKQI